MVKHIYVIKDKIGGRNHLGSTTDEKAMLSRLQNGIKYFLQFSIELTEEQIDILVSILAGELPKYGRVEITKDWDDCLSLYVNEECVRCTIKVKKRGSLVIDTNYPWKD